MNRNILAIENCDAFKFYDQMKFIYGPVNLEMIKNPNGIYKKKPTIKLQWRSQMKSHKDPHYNSTYIITGEKSNCFVVDIDDVDKNEDFIKDLDQESNFICKSRQHRITNINLTSNYISELSEIMKL
jgi:hypothetical protein